MKDMIFTARELLLYVMVIGVVLGALFGLIPFLLGRRRGQGRLGIYGLLACGAAGAISPIISAIVAGVFAWIIVKRKPEVPQAPADPFTKSEES